MRSPKAKNFCTTDGPHDEWGSVSCPDVWEGQRTTLLLGARSSGHLVRWSAGEAGRFERGDAMSSYVLAPIEGKERPHDVLRRVRIDGEHELAEPALNAVAVMTTSGATT